MFKCIFLPKAEWVLSLKQAEAEAEALGGRRSMRCGEECEAFTPTVVQNREMLA